MSLPGVTDEGYTTFNGVTYLGCALVNAPRSEVEIYRNMSILNEQSKQAIPIELYVPRTSEGNVRWAWSHACLACTKISVFLIVTKISTLHWITITVANTTMILHYTMFCTPGVFLLSFYSACWNVGCPIYVVVLVHLFMLSTNLMSIWSRLDGFLFLIWE